MYCKNCGTQHDGKFCPNCGAPASENTQYSPSGAQDQSGKASKPITGRWWFWVLIAVTVAVVVTTLTTPSKSSTDVKADQSAEDAGVSALLDTIESAVEDSAEAQDVQDLQDALSSVQGGVSSEAIETTVGEQVLLDQSGIKVTLLSLDYDGWFGPTMSVLIENSSAKAVTVQVCDFSVNGAMIDGYLYSEVAAGKKANDEITLSETDLENSGIDTIQTIEFYFSVFDPESWETIFETDVITVTTNAPATFSQVFDDSGSVVLNQNGIRVIVQGLDATNSIWGADVLFVIENNSGSTVTVMTDNVSVNGFMIDPYFSSEVVSGKIAYEQMSFMQEDLDECGIDAIETIELTFHVYDSDNWNTLFNSDIVTISFPM